MKTRKLELNEHNLTRALWEEIFNEDSKEFLDYYYFMKAKDNEIYVIENDQEICSMLHLNPYALKLEDTQFQGSYIVGVATKPLHRKKDIWALYYAKAYQICTNAKSLLHF